MEEINLIQRWNSIVNEYIEKIKDFSVASQMICNEYNASKEPFLKDQFNVFRIISDLYYRENFHSDIMKFFLDPKEKHGCGNVFLLAFVDMLNKYSENEIKRQDYNNATVNREEPTGDGYIDIVIWSDSSKKAIVIENKINNAPDMKRQLPRYYDYVYHKMGCCIDAIVYIPLDVSKKPDRSTWEGNDEKNLKPLLKIVPAFSDASTVNIVTNWIEPSISLTNNTDVASTLKQYAQLIKTLNHNYMNTVVMEKFYNELMLGENLNLAKSIREMLDDLPYYLAQRIRAKYENNCNPFSHIWIDKYWNTVFEGSTVMICGMHLKIHVKCSVDGYYVEFVLWDDDNRLNEYRQLVRSLSSLEDFEKNINDEKYYYKQFGFNEEGSVIELIDKLLAELRKRTNKE